MAQEKRVRVNRAIRALEVRLIAADGQQLGVVPLEQALATAEDAGLDLVEVAPNAEPPVCRIMDYGKFKYEQSKKAQQARKKQTFIQLKEVKMRPRTDVHDMNVKKGRIRRFLEEGNKVKVTMTFRGREIVHSNIGREILERVAEEFADVARVEHMPNMEGRIMHMILAPLKEN